MWVHRVQLFKFFWCPVALVQKSVLYKSINTTLKMFSNKWWTQFLNRLIYSNSLHILIQHYSLDDCTIKEYQSILNVTDF